MVVGEEEGDQRGAGVVQGLNGMVPAPNSCVVAASQRYGRAVYTSMQNFEDRRFSEVEAKLALHSVRALGTLEPSSQVSEFTGFRTESKVVVP